MRPFAWLICSRCLFGVAGYWVYHTAMSYAYQADIPILAMIAGTTYSMGSAGTLLEVYIGIMLGEYIHDAYNFKLF